MRKNSPVLKSRLNSYLEHHLRVSLASLGRLYAQPIATFMTVTVIAIALALPTGLYIALNNIGQLSSGWDGSSKVSLFLQTKVNLTQAKQLQTELLKNPAIANIVLIDKEQGLKQFKKISGFGDALKYLNTNPLPIVLVILPKPVAQQPKNISRLISTLNQQPLVELAQLDVQWVKRLYRLLEIANRSIWVIGSLLALAVLLVVGNTIRLDIQNRREEIEVSKLVGASDAFIQRPFLYTGFWYGFLGGGFAWFISLMAILVLQSPIQKLALLYQSDFQLIGLTFAHTALLVALSCLLGLVGSFIAVGRHLKDIEPS